MLWSWELCAQTSKSEHARRDMSKICRLSLVELSQLKRNMTFLWLKKRGQVIKSMLLITIPLPTATTCTYLGLVQAMGNASQAKLPT
jgi:hypothetical protein